MDERPDQDRAKTRNEVAEDERAHAADEYQRREREYYADDDFYHQIGRMTEAALVADENGEPYLPQAAAEGIDRLVAEYKADKARIEREDGRAEEMGIPDALDRADRRKLLAEVDSLRAATYVELEVQVAGWNFAQVEGGIPFHEMPEADRQVAVEDYVGWSYYMERGLTFEDQGQIIREAARDSASGHGHSKGLNILDEPGEFRSHEDMKALSAEIRAEEHAARVQAYGEADAATYEERIAEATRYREAQSGPPAPTPPAPITEAELAEIERSWARSGTAREAAGSGDKNLPSTSQVYDPAEFARSGGAKAKDRGIER